MAPACLLVGASATDPTIATACTQAAFLLAERPSEANLSRRPASARRAACAACPRRNSCSHRRARVGNSVECGRAIPWDGVRGSDDAPSHVFAAARTSSIGRRSQTRYLDHGRDVPDRPYAAAGHTVIYPARCLYQAHRLATRRPLACWPATGLIHAHPEFWQATPDFLLLSSLPRQRRSTGLLHTNS